MMYRKLTAGVLAGSVVVLAGLGSGMVQAAPAASPSPAVLPVVLDTTTVLPIMGAQLTIHVQTGPGGNISLAEIVPADLTMTAVASPNRVSFTNAAGTVKVNVKSKGNNQSISARTDSLANISGNGTWSGDVFSTGALTTVGYTIGGTTDPTITNVTSSDAAAVIAPVKTSTGEEGGSSATELITFTLNGQSRTLSIRASVRTFVPEAEHDDDSTSTTASAPPAPVTVASLRVTLSGFKGVPQDLTTLVNAGKQTWKGFLCDGTAASIEYTANADGSLTLGTVTPAALQSSNDNGQIDVRFTDSARVRIRGKVDGTNITVKVQEKIRCEGAPDPTVNGAGTVLPGNQGHDGHDGGGDHNGGGDHHNGGGKGNGGGGD